MQGEARVEYISSSVWQAAASISSSSSASSSASLALAAHANAACAGKWLPIAVDDEEEGDEEEV